ncbi:MAG: acyl carrier protein [Gammaproteobacteria bacterium]|nr:acyl carrier protein [Gammaproteobacteria bacterium]
MTEKSKQEQIQEFIGTLNPAAKDGIDNGANLLEEEIVDSVAMMDLIVWFEENFNMTIDPDDLTPDNFGSVNAMVAYLER